MAQQLPNLVVDAGDRRDGSPIARKAFVVVADVIAIIVGMGAAYFALPYIPRATSPPASQAAPTALLSLPFWIGAFVHYRLYRARNVTSRLQEFQRVVHACLGGVIATGFLSAMFHWSMRGWVVVMFPMTLATVLGAREISRRVFDHRRRSGKLLRRVVIVGTGIDGLALCEMLRSDPVLGYDVVGFLDDTPFPDTHHPDGYPPLLGDLHDVVGSMRRCQASGAIITTSGVSADAANRIARELTAASFHVELSSSLKDVSSERLSLRPLGRYPMMYLEPVHFSGWRAAAKWGFDHAAAALGLIVASPLLLAIAVAIKLDSRGPVLFRQWRVGRDGKLFQILKFRTMVANAEELRAGLVEQNQADGPLFKLRDDPRVTRVGRWLRRLSLDELPQVWNVMRGEMSLVGPRPAIPSEMDGWSEPLRNRLRVKPGMTGLWQVNGRSNASFEDYVRFDLYYVENWSFWVDVAIITKTIPLMLSKRGAY